MPSSGEQREGELFCGIRDPTIVLPLSLCQERRKSGATDNLLGTACDMAFANALTCCIRAISRQGGTAPLVSIIPLQLMSAWLVRALISMLITLQVVVVLQSSQLLPALRL
ncbi:hypothetical protein M3J09_000239 [Ascochyta lentis]